MAVNNTVADSSRVLFEEIGARWRTVAYGPVLCIGVFLWEWLTASQVHWFALLFFALILAGIIALQVMAARRHVSVVLTAVTLRQGAEELPLGSIAEVLAEADPYAEESQPWESARSLGELSAVPRRRRGIGLRLTDGSLVQAWARDDDGLRERLSGAVGASGGG
jgi:hypothetical protein